MGVDFLAMPLDPEGPPPSVATLPPAEANPGHDQTIEERLLFSGFTSDPRVYILLEQRSRGGGGTTEGNILPQTRISGP